MASQVKSGMIFDMTALERSLIALANTTMPEAARRGLYNAAGELIRDANTVEPKTPHDEGHLKGSAIRQVDSDPTKIICLAGFNIGYAVYTHEAAEVAKVMPGWTESGSGPKYLESKLPRFKDKYIKIACETIRKAIFKK